MDEAKQGRDYSPLADILAIAMRHAREVQGYSIVDVDHALAQAMVVETMQRVAMLTEMPKDETPSPETLAEILSSVLNDVRSEALRMLKLRIH